MNALRSPRTRPTRPYRQTARAEASAETVTRILDATFELMMSRWVDEITLEDIAGRSGVNARTVLRRFGSRDGVIAEVTARFRQQIDAAGDREIERPGDLRELVRVLSQDFESYGEFRLRGLAQEARFEFLREIFNRVRERHRLWIARAIAPQLALLAEPDRDERVRQVAALTWTLNWQALRGDFGLSREAAEDVVLRSVEAALRPAG